MSSKIETVKEETIDGFPKWEVENAADTLSRSFEIKAKPKLFAAAIKVLKKKEKAAQKALNWADKL